MVRRYKEIGDARPCFAEARQVLADPEKTIEKGERVLTQRLVRMRMK
jgi:hypothetical protein